MYLNTYVCSVAGDVSGCLCLCVSLRIKRGTFTYSSRDDANANK